MPRMKTTLVMVGIACIAAVIGYLAHDYVPPQDVVKSAEAAAGVVTGPNKVAPDRYVYYPGTERLAKDEVRVIACGTGMPEARRGQASACFVFEFGNGEKMIFDLGTGSMRNIASLMIGAAGGLGSEWSDTGNGHGLCDRAFHESQ